MKPETPLTTSPSTSPAAGKTPVAFSPPASDQIPINGRQQILDMLRVADPQFRESILRRLSSRDLRLANSLRRDLKNLEVEY
ncbi:MAG: hypothetical protein ACO3A2_08690 [Bdellovibrionia bacterium]